MPRLYRFRSVEDVVGTFVLVTLGLGVVLLVLAGRAQHWFAPRYELLFEVGGETPDDLVGMEVRILGERVGEIGELREAEGGELVAVADVRHPLCRELKQTAQAQVRSSVLPPETWIAIDRGSGALIPRMGHRFAWKASAGLMEQMEKLLEATTNELKPRVALIDEVLAAYRDLGLQLAENGGPLAPNLERLERVLALIESGPGVVPQALHNEAWAASVDSSTEAMDAAFDSIRGAADSVKEGAESIGMGARDIAEAAREVHAASVSIADAAVNLGEVLRDVRQTTAELPETGTEAKALVSDSRALVDELRSAVAELTPIVRDLGAEAQDLPGTLDHARGTLREIERLVEALQRHWLVRAYVQEDAPGSALAPHRVPLRSTSSTSSTGEERP